ncbi:hypothetical protein [Ralstonia pseudosolanacearum]|uniref:hypothetical protein n=1 Tax=Ralstonia pseudosolanacearum TaxID=1310165 RepID=UPI0023DAC872|nr:hypothetical protein [Ralstonia pseudosolanacearum]
MGRRIGCVLAISVWSAVACTPVIVGPSYTMEVRLADGRPVRCAVNQPMAPVMAPGTSAPLTTRERNEAEVLATQPLRLQVGPRAPYPTPYTAPDIRCIALPA